MMAASWVLLQVQQYCTSLFRFLCSIMAEEFFIILDIGYLILRSLTMKSILMVIY